jgi:hypothetical protein
MQNETSLLETIYRRLYGPQITMANLDELAADLSRVSRRSRPWTGKFLHSLIKGYSGFKATPQLVEALQILTHRLDGVDDIQARTRQVQLRTLNELPAETIILGQARRCAGPGCQVLFVPTHPRQKYHSKSCARLSRKLIETPAG